MLCSTPQSIYNFLTAEGLGKFQHMISFEAFQDLAIAGKISELFQDLIAICLLAGHPVGNMDWISITIGNLAFECLFQIDKNSGSAPF